MHNAYIIGAAIVRFGMAVAGGFHPGLLSRGHPLGASGVAQVAELVRQLRKRCGERQVAAAKVAFAHVVGGSMQGVGSGACAIHVLTA